MFSLRDYPLWFYKIFTLKNLQTIYPSNSYNLFRKLLSLSEQATFSNRAGCFLFSSRLLSLFEQTIFTLQHTKSLKKRLKNKQKPTPSYKQSPQPFYKQKPTTFLPAKANSLQQTKSTTFLQAKANSLQQTKPTAFNKQSPQPHHIPNAQKTLRKTSKSSKISPIFHPLTYF